MIRTISAFQAPEENLADEACDFVAEREEDEDCVRNWSGYFRLRRDEGVSVKMDVARLKMCYCARERLRSVIEVARKLKSVRGLAVTVMMEAEGSEIYIGVVVVLLRCR